MPGDGAETAGRSARTRLEGLDALRGIAALLVAVMHLNHVVGDDALFHRAYLAVDLFFVLSGYVLARAYEGKFARGLGLAEFGRARLRRLWPTMIVGASIGLMILWSPDRPLAALTAFAMTALFIPFPQPGLPLFPVNPPAWSILFELFANLVHFLVLRFLGVRALAALVVVLAAGLLAWAPNLNLGNLPGEQWLGMARVIAGYASGILIWRVCGERAFLPGWLGVVLLPLAILGGGLLPGWADFAFAFVLCPLIVVSGLAPLPFGGRVLTFLGTISFPLYALHYPVAMLAARADFGPALSLPLALAAAWLVHLALNRDYLPLGGGLTGAAKGSLGSRARFAFSRSAAAIVVRRFTRH